MTGERSGGGPTALRAFRGTGVRRRQLPDSELLLRISYRTNPKTDFDPEFELETSRTLVALTTTRPEAVETLAVPTSSARESPMLHQVAGRIYLNRHAWQNCKRACGSPDGECRPPTINNCNTSGIAGQRDKPFVSDEDMRFRTPRPNILSVPPNSNYYEGLKEAETKYPVHPGNSIVGIADSITDANNNDLDSAKQNFRPPTSWSTRNGGKNTAYNFTNFNKSIGSNSKKIRDNTDEVSQRTEPAFVPTPNNNVRNINRVKIPPPSRELSPPIPPPTTEHDTEGLGLDVRGRAITEDPVFNFIKRFDPNTPDAHKTSMTKTEIIELNKELPAGQVSSEEERTPRKNKNFRDTINKVLSDKKKGVTENTRFDSVHVKSGKTTEGSSTLGATGNSQIPVPDKHLLPPKLEYSPVPSTTMGPPIYYEWKWAVPAFDLEPPKETNVTNTTGAPQKRTAHGKRPFSDVTPRTTTLPNTPAPLNTEYNISSYFVPDYIFPLDKPHPSYEDDNAETSFHVKVARPGRASYGENEECPQCHPAYLKPGTCEPCIVKR